MGSAAVGGGTLLGAGELYHNDGPFDVPDDYNRLNGVLRYHHGDDRDFYTVTAMAYSGKWNSTDQVPQRAITDGDNRSLRHPQPHRRRRVEPLEPLVQPRDSAPTPARCNGSAYVIRYQLDLWSTFTDYLKRSRPRRSDAAARRSRGVRRQRLQDLVCRLLRPSARPTSSAFKRESMTFATSESFRPIGAGSSVPRKMPASWNRTARCTRKTAFNGLKNCAPCLGVREDQFNFDVKDKMRNATAAAISPATPRVVQPATNAPPCLVPSSESRSAPGPRPPFSSTPAPDITATMPAE